LLQPDIDENQTSLDPVELTAELVQGIGHGEDSDATPDDMVSLWTRVSAPQFSWEIHLNNGSEGSLRWVTGLYYLQIDGRYLETIGYGPSIGAPTLQEDYRLTTKSWSEFGQAEYDIVKNLTLTVGGRWSMDQKRLNLRINQLTCDNILQTYSPWVPST